MLDLARAATCRLCHKQAAVVIIRSSDDVYRFACTDSLLVVGVARARAIAGEGLQTLAFPTKRKAAIGQRIAYAIICDALPVVADKFTCPPSVVE